MVSGRNGALGGLGKSWWSLGVALVLVLLFSARIAAQDGGVRFFEETGQRIDNQYGFLAFWESHDGPEIFGPPITGIVLEANVPVQYFERGRLEFRSGAVTTGALGRERTRWRTFPAGRPTHVRAGGQFFVETSHSVSGPFLRFWREHDGATIFGPPLSEPIWEPVGTSSVRVQYFERARLEQGPAGSGTAIRVSPIGREIALAKGLITPDQQLAVAIAEVAGNGGDRPAFEELAPPTPTPIPPTPTPVPPTRTPAPPTSTPLPGTPISPSPPSPTATQPVAQASPSPTPTPAPEVDAAAETGRIIYVDLSAQWLAAYENGIVIYEAPVATGKDGFETPTGTYDIYHKVRLQTMRGNVNGEVWNVPDVPDVMYINGGVALHGTYWHSQFGTGTRMSHGCVNLSLADAQWLYDWAPVGTTVVVHD